MSKNDPLGAKLRRFSRSPTGASTAPTEGETVIVAANHEGRAEAFEEARRWLDRGAARVRIVGQGTTLPRAWPPWLASEPRVVCTELGAFNAEPYVVSTNALQADLRAWLDQTFAGVFEGRPSDVLYVSACARFLQTAIRVVPIVRSMVTAFPGGTFVLVDAGYHAINGGWDPRLAAGMMAKEGARVEQRSATKRSRVPWALRVASVGGAALAGSLARQVGDFVRAAPSRKELARRRRTRPGAEPDTWVTLMPDWARANAIPIDAFALPLLERGRRLGVLLVSTLQPGGRDEAGPLRATRSATLWPGLGKLLPHLASCTIEHAVVPERWLAFLSTLARAGVGSARVLSRIATRPTIRTRDAELELDENLWPVVSLATLDVIRAALVERAVDDLAERHRLQDAGFVFSWSSMAGLAAADLALQRYGARTINSPDGAGSDQWTGTGTTVSQARCVWTDVDRLSLGSTCDRIVVAGMPVRQELPPRAQTPKHVLLLNNHGHRELFVNGVFRERLLQEELLDVARRLVERGEEGLVFRWRPHPAASPESLPPHVTTPVPMEMSNGRTLEEDAAWADLIVASYSSAIFELLFASVPIFVQLPSEMAGLPALAFLDEERGFLDAEEGAAKVLAALEALRRSAADALAPEQRAREILFGPSRRPQGLAAVLDELNRTTPVARIALAEGGRSAG